MYICVFVKQVLFLPQFEETGIISTNFRKIPNSNFIKIRPVEAESLPVDTRMDGRTDRHDEANTNLITVQNDATYSVYYISVGSSTCFGC